MKWITGTVLAVALATGVASTVLAGSVKVTTLTGGQQIRGQVESINGSVVKIKTAAGEDQTYKVDPALISALKLQNGSNIVIDGTRLLTGKISGLDAYTAEVVLDKGGDEQTYVLTREARRYLAVGDRVVITPDLRVVRQDRYRLSSSELRIQSMSTVASSSASSSSVSSSTTVQTQTITGGATTPAPVPAPVTAPPASVPGLW